MTLLSSITRKHHYHHDYHLGSTKGIAPPKMRADLATGTLSANLFLRLHKPNRRARATATLGRKGKEW